MTRHFRANGVFYESEVAFLETYILGVIDTRKHLVEAGLNPAWSVTRAWEYAKVLYSSRVIHSAEKSCAGGIKILDIGSGVSALPFCLEELTCKAYAVDTRMPNKKDLEYFKKQGIDYKKASIFDLPFKNSFFDFVYSICTLEHIHPWKNDDEIVKETVTAFEEIGRVLKPGGITAHSCDFYVKDFNTYRTYHKDLLYRIIRGVGNIFEPIDKPDYEIDDPFDYYIENNTQYGKPEDRELKHLQYLRRGKKPANLFTCASIVLRKL